MTTHTDVPEPLPQVSVVIVNYNGSQFLSDCLESLGRLSYPLELISIYVVDNHSTDNSIELLARNFPHVMVVALETNLGFAQANNVGVGKTGSPLVALLNNDTRVDSDWLSALVRLKQSAPDVACVGAKMLSWDGKRIDFVQGELGFYGHAFQRDAGRPSELYQAEQPYEILFACGGSMLVDREIFLASGGFDAEYFAYFEDVDFGWRLWLMGYRVLFAPGAVTYHRLSATGARTPFFQRMVLFERNALFTLYKNLQERDVWRFLSASLLLTYKRQERWLNVGTWDPRTFEFNAPVSADQLCAVRPEVLSQAVAVNEFIDKMEIMRDRRALVQSWRKRSDDEILPLFNEALRPHILQRGELDDAYAVGHYLVASVTEITRQFAALPRRVLLTHGNAVSGTPRAALESRVELLSNALREAGHEVILLVPSSAGTPAAETRQMIVSSLSDWMDILYRVNPDVVIACGFEALERFPHCHVPLVLDETRWDQLGAEPSHAAELNRVDFFICSSPAEQHAAGETLQKNGFSNVTGYHAVVALDGHSDRRDGIATLDRLCRLPTKRRRYAPPASGDNALGTPNANSLQSANAPRRKTLRQLLAEALFHYRRGGIRVMSIETLGFIRRRFSRRRWIISEVRKSNN